MRQEVSRRLTILAKDRANNPGEAQISLHYLRRITATNIKRKIKKVA